MTIRDVESFAMSPNLGDYVTYGRLLVQPYGVLISSGGAYGDRYLNFQGSASLPRRVIPGGPFTTLFFSCRLNLATSGSAGVQFFDLINNLCHVSILFNYLSQSITISNAAGVLLQTNAGQFPPNAWFWMSCQVTVGSGTSGAVHVRYLNKSIDLTGVNTQNGSRALIDSTAFYGNGGIVGFQHCIWNDGAGSYNNSYASDQRVYGSLATAAGDTTQFTPVGNAVNWQNAAETPPAGDTDYNVTGTVGNADLYKGSFPALITGVSAAMVSAITRKDDSGTRSFATLLKSGGTLATGASVPMASSYTTQTDVYETDPSTGVPILPSALSALQFGGKVAA